MFWDDILLVTQQLEKYGPRGRMVDLGGQANPCIADYVLTSLTGDQHARYLSLQQRPFDHIDSSYLILNPEQGDPFIEDLPKQYSEHFGVAVCLNVLEHVQNPFKVFDAFYKLMSDNSLLIIETVFSFPYHPSPMDFWRFTPESLRFLGEDAGFSTLECDWRLTIPADEGIENIHNREPQEIRSVYATFAKGNFQAVPGGRFTLPKRQSNYSEANRLIELFEAPDILNREAELLFQSGKTPEAKALLRALVARHPNHVGALSNLAVITWNSGDNQQALSYVSKAAELEPDNRDAISNYAEILMSIGRVDEAYRICSDYLTRNQADIEIRQLMETLEDSSFQVSR